MGLPAGQFRALDTQQFHRLDERLDKIGSELELLNGNLSKLVLFADEITRAEEEPDGQPAEQGPVAPTDHTS